MVCHPNKEFEEELKEGSSSNPDMPELCTQDATSITMGAATIYFVHCSLVRGLIHLEFLHEKA